VKLSPNNPDGKPNWDKAGGEAAFKHLPPGDLLLPYQARAHTELFGGTALLVIEKSRRIGLTWGLAAYAVLRAAAQPSAGGMDVWYMGYDQDMAREFIETAAMWARAFKIAAEEADEETIGEKDEAVQAFRIRFSSGFKIVGLPSVARALRGKQGLVIVDEAAFHKNLMEVLKAALAFLMWGGQVVVVSTHDGVGNPFNLLLDDIRSKRRKGVTMTITFDDAIADGLYERIALAASIKSRDILPKAEWIADIWATYGDDADEELGCIPKEGSGSWLNPQDLAACEHPDAGKPELYSGKRWYLGRDVARRRDLAVFHGYEEIADVLWLRDRLLFHNTKFSIQDDAAAALIAERMMSAYWIDQTGMGEKVVEDEQGKYGMTRCHGVLLTGPARLDLAQALKERVEAVKIRLPPVPALRTDFRAIKRKGSISGGVSLINDDTVHADEFWAAGLACRAASLGGGGVYAYHSLRQRELQGQSALARRRFENENPGAGGGFRGFRH
jgi:phage FluMu gp28-like protein